MYESGVAGGGGGANGKAGCSDEVRNASVMPRVVEGTLAKII